jgi:hypothetical protein
MRGRWRPLACVAVVLLAHAGLLAALLRAPASGVRHPPAHRTAAVRIVVLGPVAEPRVARPLLGAAPDSAPPLTRVPPPDGPAFAPAAVPEPLAVATRSALAPERVAPAPPSPRIRTIAPTHEFLSPAEVDRIAIAFPSPEISSLSGLSWSGMPIRLRLFIAASGQCVDVKVLRASEDADTLERLRRMFLDTHFLPARRAGADVDSYRDIELDVTDVK